MAKAYHKRTGNPLKTKVVSRDIAYHGTHHGALAITGINSLRTEFEPLAPGTRHAPNTNTFHDDEPVTRSGWPTRSSEIIEFEGPETVAAVFLEPVQNAGGCYTPPEGYFQRVREICDRHDVLLVSDEVICSWGRLGYYFGHERYGYSPDIVTTAKGITSAYAAMGAVIATDKVAEPFMQGDEVFNHGITFGGHPMSSAVALANIEIFEREDLCGHVLKNEPAFRSMLDGPARPPDRRRRARRRLLPCDRAGQGQKDARDLHRRGVGAAAARLSLERTV